MGRIETLSLLLIAGFLVSGPLVDAQTTDDKGLLASLTTTIAITTEASVLLTSSSCKSFSGKGAELCIHVSGTIDLNLLLAGNLPDACAYSLLQYACADVGAANPNTIASIWKCHITNPESVLTQEAMSLLISKLPLETLRDTLNIINAQVPASTITPRAKEVILNSVWERLRTNSSGLSPGLLASWFQERLYLFLSAINIDILDCMIQLPLTCDGFEAVVTALDVVYVNFNNNTRQVIGNWISRFIRANSCRKSSVSEWIISYFRQFKNDVNYKDYKTAWNNVDLSLALDEVTSFQVADYAINSNAFSSVQTSSAIIEHLNKKNIFYIVDFLDSLSQLSGSSSVSYQQDVLFSLLQITLLKLNNTNELDCKPRLDEIFQVKAKFLLRAINESALQLIPNVDCSDFFNIFKGVDLVYDDLSDENKLAVFKFRQGFLKKEALKAGSGCTYGLSSKKWIQESFGLTFKFLTYSEVLTLNPSFNGFEALDILTLNQTLDVIFESNILTNAESSTEVDSQVSAIVNLFSIKGFAYLEENAEEIKQFLVRSNITSIPNPKVRCSLLDSVWELLVKEFPQFTLNEWSKWFNDYLPLLLPCIKKQQLDDLSVGVVKDCSNFQAIVQGLDVSFDYMSEETKGDIALWLQGFLKAKQCNSLDWLNVNFRQFKTFVNISIIKELNEEFDLLGSIEEFSARQIGEIVVYEETARTSVEVIQSIFDVLVNVPAEKVEQNLGYFWDRLNEVYTEVNVVNITEEVQYTMLERTTTGLAQSFTSFTAERFNFWFTERFKFVIRTIDDSILSKIPLEIGNSQFKAVVRSVDEKYDDIEEENKKGIFNYFKSYLQKGTGKYENETSKTFILNYFGRFSQFAIYEDISSYYTNFDILEEGVLGLLTETQIGDAMVVDNIVQNRESSTKLFNYFSTVSYEKVDKCFIQFTKKAIEKNIKIESVEVGQYLLQSYLTIVQSQIRTYTEEQLVQLFETRLFLLIRFFTRETLSLFAVRNCNSLVVVVNHLDKSFNSLSTETIQAIANWIISILKQADFKGCQVESQRSWVETTFKQFFKFVKLEDIVTIHQNFDFIEVIDNTSTAQKADYIVRSDALTNVSKTEIVLKALQGETSTVSTTTIIEFLESFNVAFGQLSIQKISVEVRETIMTFLFTSWTSNFNLLKEEEIAMFGELFQYFLSGIKVETLTLISLEMNCNHFQITIHAFNNVYDSLSEGVRKALFDVIIAYLNHHSTSSSGQVCGTLYTDSKTYLTSIYFRFVSYATFYEMNAFYNKFNAYEVLDVFSGKQLGNLLINSSAIREQKKAVQILVELDKRSVTEVNECMVEINRVVEEKNIISLPNANIESLILDTVLAKIPKEDYLASFGAELKILLPSLSVTVIEDLPTNADCDSQTSAVRGFGEVFELLSEEQRVAIHKFILNSLTQKKKSQGDSCNSDKSSSEWIVVNYGPFRNYASLKEFAELKANFSVVSALSECTGTQIADFVIAYGGLNSVETITTAFKSLQSTEEVLVFYEQLNEVAASELRASLHVQLILEYTFEIISVDFKEYKEEQWTEWFQVTLQNVLFAVNATQLEIIPLPLPCSSFQQIVKGFDKAFDLMNEQTRQAVYETLIKRQFESLPVTDVICGEKSVRTQEWIDINFGSFWQYALFTNILKWNKGFVATDVISTLSVEQLAEVALQPTTINNEEVACQIVGKLQEFQISDVYLFLDQFNSYFIQLNISDLPNEVIRLKFLSASIDLIEENLPTYSAGDWETLLSVRLRPFLKSINSELLDLLLKHLKVNDYPILIKHLNEVYDSLSLEVRESLYGSLSGYLISAFETIDSPVSVGGEDTDEWVLGLLGKFSVYAQYSDFVKIRPNFDGLQVISSLSPEQVGELAFSGDILSNQLSADIVVNTLGGWSFSQIDYFLSSFQANAEQRGILSLANVNIRSSLLNVIYSKLSANFHSFTLTQWREFFSVKLSFFLGSITESQINLIPSNIDCDVFQIIVSALDSHFQDLSNSSRQAFYQKAKAYLLAKKQGSVSACSEKTSGSIGWLQTNLGSFRALASYQDIISLKPDFIFTDAVSILNENQLASYCVESDALRYTDKIAKVFTGVRNLDLGAFLDAFNLAAEQKHLTQLPNADVRKFFIGEVFCQLGSRFSLFAAEDFTFWFSGRLKLFVSGLNAKTLGFIPTDISCDSLAAIIGTLSNAQSTEYPEDIYNFLKSVLATQLENSGSACTSAGLSDREWLLKYFGKYSTFAKWSDVIALNPTVQVLNTADLLTDIQLASASVSTTIISNVTAISDIFVSISDDTDFLFNFLGSLGEFVLKDSSLLANTKVRDAILMHTAEIVFPKFNGYPLTNVESWMTKIGFLLPGINATMLDFISLDVPCTYYKTIIQGLDKIFPALTLTKKSDVANFAKKYLTHQKEVNDNICLSATDELSQWINNNLGRFCRIITVSDIKAFYPDVDTVSYERVCVFS